MLNVEIEHDDCIFCGYEISKVQYKHALGWHNRFGFDIRVLIYGGCRPVPTYDKT